MKTIDIENWPRAEHYRFFKRMDYPNYHVCANVDITGFLEKTKENGLSFYYSFVYAAMHAINDTEEFRYRIRGDDVVLHDIVHPAFSDMTKGSDLFKMVAVNMTEDMESFVAAAKTKSLGQTEFFIKEELEGRDDLVYISAIPWISFTNVSHTISFNKDDAVPRLYFGKYFKDGNKTLMPFSIQAHHSFVDGIHMGKYYECLQRYLDEF